MGKIILNLAISLDGYISDEEGNFDWIVGHDDHSLDTQNTFNYNQFLESIDMVVMGSKAYEDCILSDLQTFDMSLYVATSRELEVKNNAVFIKGNVCSQIEALKKKVNKNIWLFGGAGLTDQFIKANIVDQYIIGIIPTILGKGRRLFKGDYPKINLHLDDYSIHDGITILTYSKQT